MEFAKENRTGTAGPGVSPILRSNHLHPSPPFGGCYEPTLDAASLQLR